MSLSNTAQPARAAAMTLIPTVEPLSGHLNLGGTNPQGRQIDFNSFYMRHNGVPVIPVMGEFHYSRYAASHWEDAVLKMKAGGITILATYIFWIHIEEDEGVFDWSGNKNLRAFIEVCAKHSLDVIIRIGPFDHGECRNGGLPDWIYGRPFEVRSTDPRFLAYTHRLYEQIAAQVEGLLFKDNGPIIGVQLDNEYMHCGAPWETTYRPGTEWVPAGTEGAAYLAKLKELARAVGLDVPIYTGTGWLHSPIVEGEMLPMQGGYAFQPWSPDPNFRQPPTREYLFRNRHLYPVLNGDAAYDAPRYPLVCCEIGGGIQITYYHRPIVPPQSVEALALMNLGSGSNLIGYYMYHGGTNPIGKHGYLNEFTVPRLSYDFQAPIREYGQINTSYRHLRLLHTFLADFGDVLAPMTVSLPDNALTITPENTTDLRWIVRSKDDAGFIFLNNYQDHVEMQDIPNIQFQIQRSQDVLTIPHAGTLTLQKEVSAILPFGLLVDGIKLTYATTQLLTQVSSDDGPLYVFFAPHGLRSEYAFDPTSYATLTAIQGNRQEIDGLTIVSVVPGLDCLITLTTHDNRTIRILTLTREQAEMSAKHMLWGRERLVISDADFVPSGDEAFLHIQGKDIAEIWVYPAPEHLLVPSEAHIGSGPMGMFVHYRLTLSTKEIPVTVTPLSDSKATISVPPDALEGVDNVLLQIDYVGDTGSAYVDGRLIADHFYNGLTWEIGLAQAAPTLPEIVLMIAPIVKNAGGARYIQTGMAFRPDAEGEALSVLNRVKAVPMYKIGLRQG